MLFLVVLMFFGCAKDSDLFVQTIEEEIIENIEEENNENNEEGTNEQNDEEQNGNNPGEDPILDETYSTDLKAFPTAYGAGAYATGGRGGRVIAVTNLNDSGEGSLRAALNTSGPRTIVFRVSGEIRLRSELYVTNDDFTIAGQTAPEGGITVTGNRFSLGGISNAIIRYIRFKGGEAVNEDSISGSSMTNVIFDHVSVGFGGDEGFSLILYNEASTIDGITVQRCLISESKTGSIFGGSEPVENGAGDISILNNMWYNITHRHPNMGAGGTFEVINNIVWGFRWRIHRVNEAVTLNHINNWYYFAEENTHNGLKGSGSAQGNKWYSESRNIESVDFSVHTWGNVYEGNPRFSYTDSQGFIYDGSDKSNFGETWVIYYADNDPNYDPGDDLPAFFEDPNRKPLLGEPVPILSAQETYNNVSNDVGCNKRLGEDGRVYINYDIEDAEYVNAVRTRDYINRISDDERFVTPFTGSSWGDNYDTDMDGMPDVWEVANYGSLATGANDDTDGDGYTNLEEFLNLVDL
ncbi:hypothetical protein L0P88_19500 [Muricauda sp. SCSIO 64092]|uniref:pectate lyase family protein n=1 Tax=Allomuricauda sp. SCSIO 64092 TaxID=2908842 RepID=UPI001FF1CF1F|nr:hypothetical protein [Muricauda sp. SCSIO 64092]UOY06099.1 hypothetical protein L0P88_19500 [Muricauda sp. SCSIO 64092]